MQRSEVAEALYNGDVPQAVPDNHFHDLEQLVRRIGDLEAFVRRQGDGSDHPESALGRGHSVSGNMQTGEEPAMQSAGLEGRISLLESELRQRQEEIEQTRTGLAERTANALRLEGELEEAKVREELLRAKLEEANTWVFRLAGERTASESEKARIERDRDVKSRELLAAQAHVVRLQDMIDSLKAGQSLQQGKLLTAKSADSGDRLTMGGDAVRQRDKRRLLQHLKMSESQGVPVMTGVAATRGPGGMLGGNTELRAKVRNNDLERKLHDACSLAEWSNSVMTILLRAPKPWWHLFAPQRVRRKHILAITKKAGLFDGDAYLERYPDVARAGLDPLAHYIQHGINEGRQR